MNAVKGQNAVKGHELPIPVKLPNPQPNSPWKGKV